jgi:type II secretory pathway pseudopilin PulG
MKLCVEQFDLQQSARARFGAKQGFTVVEIVLTTALLLILVISTLDGILGMQVSAKRTADYTSAMAIAEAKLQDIRAVYYNPPTYPFTYSAVLYVTNQNSIALNQAGSSFQIPGTVISKIEYQGAGGHLVTVTASFKIARRSVTAQLQTLINSYSGGQQQ